MSAAAPQVGSAAIPEAHGTQPPTPIPDLDAAVERVRGNKDRWVGINISSRISILQELTRSTLAVSPRWVSAALRAKGITPGSPLEGEEWLAGPMTTIRNLRLLVQSLQEIERDGAPQIPGPVTTRPSGQVVAQVFPGSIYDKLLFAGFTGEIWMEPDVTLASLKSTQAVAYREKATSGKVALVLGAGNVSSIGPMDAFYKLFVEDQVVILKMNPVNEYLGPFFAEAFQPLISRGLLEIVYGGAAEGAYLCKHDGIDEIHITGSDKTHDAIVFGPGEEGARRKAAREPLNNKRITSELGNVSPLIVVPGPWSASDIEFQGANLASSLTNNAGFNCNATRLIVQHKSWSQRTELLDAVRRTFRKATKRLAYYPGAEQRFDSFLAAHPDAEVIGEREAGKLPWMLVSDLDPGVENDICFTTEAFCGVTGEVGLEANSVAEYIDRAVEFCNNEVWGTLNAGIIVHPASLKDPAVAAALDRAVENLRHGSVAVNHWPALSYGLGATTWGAFPGHDIYDIQSGVGVVHNTLMFSKAQKSVVRGPFRVRPTPPWFVTNKTVHETARKLAEFEASPSFWKLPSLFWSAVRG